MMTTDFLYTEGPLGTCAGANTPRRLIPSCFRRPEAAREADDWTGSLGPVAVVLVISAAVSIGTGLVLDHAADRSALIAPVRVSPAPASADGVDHGAEVTHPSDVRADTRDPLLHPSKNSELFE